MDSAHSLRRVSSSECKWSHRQPAASMHQGLYPKHTWAGQPSGMMDFAVWPWHVGLCRVTVAGEAVVRTERPQRKQCWQMQFLLRALHFLLKDTFFLRAFPFYVEHAIFLEAISNFVLQKGILLKVIHIYAEKMIFVRWLKYNVEKCHFSSGFPSLYWKQQFKNNC